MKYKLNTKKIAIEYNGEIIPKERYKSKFLKDKDKIEIVHFIEEDDLKKDTLIIANKKIQSGLIIGTGKYKILARLQKL